MRYTVVPTNRFRRQYRHLQRSGRPQLERKLNNIIARLAAGEPLPSGAHNHKLSGELVEFYECHIAPDWLLMYRIVEEKLILVLSATGTHSQLFG